MADHTRTDVVITINGVAYERSVRANQQLTDFLRDELGLTGTHVACNNGICGSCTVLLDGEPVRACLLLTAQADGASVVTIEGLARREADGTLRLHALQQAFVDHGAVQCGFCIPGMIMTAKALLDRNASPSRDEIVQAISGNLCRCTGYQPIIAAIQSVAAQGGR